MDTYAKIATLLIFALLIFSAIGAFAIDNYMWAGIIGFIVLLITIAVSFSLRPTDYVIDGDNIIIHKPFGKKTVLSDVQRLEEVRATGIRTFGVGGLFGYFGRFNGDDIWFVTNRKRAIRVSSHGKTYLISPNLPSEFIRKFESVN